MFNGYIIMSSFVLRVQTLEMLLFMYVFFKHGCNLSRILVVYGINLLNLIFGRNMSLISLNSQQQLHCVGRACVSSSPSGAHGEGTGEGRVRVRSVSTSSGAPAIARVIFRRDRQRDRPTTRVSFRRGKLGTRRRPRDDRDLPQTPIPRGPARSDSNCNGDVRRDGGKRHRKNTGLFCVHLLRTFIHIQIDKIPAKYIFKRYTKSARRDVAFSREDKILTGDDGNTKNYRTKLLLKKSTKVVQAGSMSKAAFERAIEGMDSVFNEIKDIPHDIGPKKNTTGRNTTGQETYRQGDSDEDMCGHNEGTQEIGQTSNAFVTENNPCHDHLNMAAGEAVGEGNKGESSDQDTTVALNVGVTQESGI